MKLCKIATLILGCIMIVAMFAACNNSEPVVERGVPQEAAADTPPTSEREATQDINLDSPQQAAVAFAGLMPTRVSVLDHSALDIVHTLGFGGYVVSVIGGRSASDALYLQDYYDSDRIAVLEVHGGGGTGSPVVSAGGGIFASANMTIMNSLVVGNMNDVEPCDVVRARPSFDGGNNHFGTVEGFEDEAFVLAANSLSNVSNETIIEELAASIGTPPVFVQRPGSGETTWAEFTAAVSSAVPGSTVYVGADLLMSTVLIIDHDVTIDGNGFTLTKADSIVGAPIVITGGEDVNVTIQNTVFDGNNFDAAHDSTDYDGGIIRARGNLAVINSLFKNGRSHMITGGVGTGGAIFSSGATLTVADSFFYNNVGVRQGGAIRSTGQLIVTGSVFVGNREERSGGGAISATGLTEISNSIFFQNSSVLGSVSSGSQGGAIHASGNNSILITNSTIVGNSAGVMLAADGGVMTNIDRFFTIDADFIIGGPGQYHLYDTVFSVIAPTMIIDATRNHADGVLAGVIEATRMIAPIWNAEEAAEAIIADLTTRFNATSASVSQSKGIAVTLNATSGGFIITSEDAFEQSLLGLMGFTHIDRDLVPEHFLTVDNMRDYAAAEQEFEMTTRDVMGQFLEWVDNHPEIDYVVVFENTFASLNEAEAAPAAGGGGTPAEPTDFSAIRDMGIYQEGWLALFSNTSNTFGLTRLDMQLSALENLFQ